VNVVGIDPAPAKGLSVFNGTDCHIRPEDAVTFIADIRTADDVLVTWDAPLSGPPTAVVAGAAARGSAFFQRPIESFFSKAATGFKTPAGVSVLGYAGCPHWALSRALVGLPRVGPYDADADALPFRLASDDVTRPRRGRHIVEVHPAVAIWLWCREERGADASWLYKRDPGVLGEVWESLMRVGPVGSVLSGVRRVPPSSDDELDARVAFALGRLWLDDPDSVVLLGDADAGAFLVPRVAGIVEAFGAFRAREGGRGG
jgi:hypothetical protein